MKNKFLIKDFRTEYYDNGEKGISINASIDPLPRDFEELIKIIINSYLEQLNISDDINTIIKKYYPENVI